MRKRALKYIQIKQEKWFQFLPTPKMRVYTLLSLMPSVFQQENLETMLGLFLEAQGYPLPQHSKSKSPSALSRFLNVYDWSTRGVIRTTRNRVIKEILSERTLGRQPFLQVIIDLTTKRESWKI
jgi:hypothetical protein